MWENKQLFRIDPWKSVWVLERRNRTRQTRCFWSFGMLRYHHCWLSADGSNEEECLKAGQEWYRECCLEIWFLDMRRVQWMSVWQDAAAAVRHDDDERKVCYNFKWYWILCFISDIIVCSQQSICLYHRPEQVKSVCVRVIPRRNFRLKWRMLRWPSISSNIVQIWQVLYPRRVPCGEGSNRKEQCSVVLVRRIDFLGS